MDVREIRARIDEAMDHVQIHDIVPPDSIDIDIATESIDLNWHLSDRPEEAREVLLSYGADSWDRHSHSGVGDSLILVCAAFGGELTIWVPPSVVTMRLEVT